MRVKEWGEYPSIFNKEFRSFRQIASIGTRGKKQTDDQVVKERFPHQRCCRKSHIVSPNISITKKLSMRKDK